MKNYNTPEKWAGPSWRNMDALAAEYVLDASNLTENVRRQNRQLLHCIRALRNANLHRGKKFSPILILFIQL